MQMEVRDADTKTGFQKQKKAGGQRRSELRREHVDVKVEMLTASAPTASD